MFVTVFQFTLLKGQGVGFIGSNSLTTGRAMRALPCPRCFEYPTTSKASAKSSRDAVGKVSLSHSRVETSHAAKIDGYRFPAVRVDRRSQGQAFWSSLVWGAGMVANHYDGMMLKINHDAEAGEDSGPEVREILNFLLPVSTELPRWSHWRLRRAAQVTHSCHHIPVRYAQVA